MRSKTKKATRIHQKIRRKKQWLSVDSESASASRATQSDAIPNGIPQNTAPEVSLPPSLNAGPKLNATDGELDQSMTPKDAPSGLTAAQVVDSTIHLGPPVNPQVRPEVAAFLRGFRLAIGAMSTVKGLITLQLFEELMATAEELSKEFYPDYDPLPEPTKKRSHAQ